MTKLSLGVTMKYLSVWGLFPDIFKKVFSLEKLKI